MQNILDVEIKPQKQYKKRGKLVLIFFIPATWLIFLLLSPVWLGIYNNEIGDQWPVGPFLLAFTIVMPLISGYLLKICNALNWKTILLLLVEAVISFAGIMLIFMYLTGVLQDFLHYEWNGA